MKRRRKLKRSVLGMIGSGNVFADIGLPNAEIILQNVKTREAARRRRRRALRWRDFPKNTCPASRNVEMAAEGLMRLRRAGVVDDEAMHIAASLWSVLGDLWQARTRISNLKRRGRAIGSWQKTSTARPR
jgi:hypothetical protein